ncbi:putative membrane protein [Aequorivita sublithincola DSM 14238]|uniref:Putative membrane protein n=1 Tax=Aequorivita sublithincola (strain DSM 14238 / LMG 21431 / ACAM 643 / 9-3) TaxID=746697 RepID=I3YWC3_AEQSU|nr:membrane protein [Aequorivita sublithincola]AFL81291.1 putative membrane protein [Aequorivita sublithincola DSM 14238]
MKGDTKKTWRHNLIRYTFYFAGLIFFGLGVAFTVKVKYLGLHPWDVLNVALFEHFGFSIGTWSIFVGLILIGISLLVSKKYVNIGTFLNALLIGPIMDFFLWLDILPDASNNWTDYLLLLLGIVVIGIGGGLYVSGGVGAGPRDGFMLSMSEKTGLSVSKARIVVESIVLVIGYLLGGPVFWVTFVFTFILSPIFQFSLKFFTRLRLRIS